MAPEYGATCGFFPVDAETLALSEDTGAACRSGRARRGLCKGAGHVPHREDARSRVHRHARARPRRRSSPRLPGPKRPQDRVAPSEVTAPASPTRSPMNSEERRAAPSVSTSRASNFDLGHGDVVIAAITSCTNTSNPSVMIGAGLLARNARQEGPAGQALGQDLARARQPGGRPNISRRPACRRISTSSASISSAMAAPPASAIPALCRSAISEAIQKNDLVAAAVLSGNRNFEGRVNPDVRANYLASPPLVVAYALAGSLHVDLAQRSARQRARRQAGLPQGHLADREGDRDLHAQVTSPRNCSRTSYKRRVQGRCGLAQDQGAKGGTYSVGCRSPPMCRTRPISPA